MQTRSLRGVVFCVVSAWFSVAGTGDLTAQTAARPAAAKEATISALMLSDVHFDPFHDPGKAKQLADAPVAEWDGILAGAASADADAAYQQLQKTCNAKGIDTPYALLESSLKAMRANAPESKFAVVSGDLVVHGFDCRFNTLLPGKTRADYSAFVTKTVQYVVGQLRSGLKGIPVYAALGNNDSGCGDYQLDASDGFLNATKETMVEGAPSAERTAALESYAKGGDYSVTMQAPMQGTRLIVLDDLVQSVKYTGCGGEPNPTAVKAQMAWFEGQLAEARLKKEKVWVMAHIPPGIDPYSTFSKMKNVCGGDAPVMFLSSERLAEVMAEYTDVIRLGVFGHTHMDEMRLFGKVPIKMVSSISPVDGNDPSFTVAKVDPVGAQLVDYEVIKTSTRSGVDAKWVKEYSFGATYHEPAFSAASLEKLMKEFKADPDVKNDMSDAYLSNYGVGTTSRGVKALALRALWPGYACAQTNDSEKDFAACVCAGPK